MNDIAQKRIMIDDQKFEIDVNRVEIAKLESLLKEYEIEKKLYSDRITDIQKTYTDEFDKNKYFEQEYVKVKESEAIASSEYKKYKQRCEALESLNDELEKQRDIYKVSVDSLTDLTNELKIQVRRSQEKIEEMNKGRRIVEEQNENLLLRLNEKNQDLLDSRRIIVDQKNETDLLKTHETELEAEVSSLQIKLKSLEKQFETMKETLQEKINNLNDILKSEKKIREN